MVKYFYFLSLLLFIALKTNAQVLVADTLQTKYYIPTDLSVADKIDLKDRLENGSILFKNYCAKCHGIFAPAKQNTPNFTNKQIAAYNDLFNNNDPKNHAVAQKMSQEQLQNVLTFLKFLK